MMRVGENNTNTGRNVNSQLFGGGSFHYHTIKQIVCRRAWFVDVVVVLFFIVSDAACHRVHLIMLEVCKMLQSSCDQLVMLCRI